MSSVKEGDALEMMDDVAANAVDHVTDQTTKQVKKTSGNAADFEMAAEDPVISVKVSDVVQGEVSNDRRTDVQEEQDVQDSSSSFARLVKGWEALAEAGARNVQRARDNPEFLLQTLSICGAGEGFPRLGPNPQIGNDSEDPFEPIVLRHTHSTPSQYTPMFRDEDGGAVPPPALGLDHMKRSSSTPSSWKRSQGSAFSHLRSMPHLGGPNDRSAFTLPARGNSFTSLSDSGVRYSAFDPVLFPPNTSDASENTAIEVTKVEPIEDVSSTKWEQDVSPSKGTASRAARFLRMSDVRSRRRRKLLSGRGNSATTSSQGADGGSKTGESVNDEAMSKNSSDPTESPGAPERCTIDISVTTRSAESPTVPFSAMKEADGEITADQEAGVSGDQYQQLDSDIDEEYEHYQRIEASIKADSPGTIPSPAYQRFEDEQVMRSSRSTESNEVEGAGHTPTVRIQVSTGQTTPEQGSTPQDGNSLTPVSQDSGIQSSATMRSTMTGNTSGHTTLATSTSATISSGHMSVLSSVSETDIEVMETNQAGKMRIRQQRKLDKLDRVVKGELDSSASVNSSSTGSTNTHGYVALAGSPAPLRDGANLPVDRFFHHSSIPVSHSVSMNSGSTGSSGSGTGPTSGSSKSSDNTPITRVLHGQGSPASVSSEVNTTNSSGFAGEEPPTFVSYLDRDTKSKSTLPTGDDGEERASPAEIVGYSHVVFEAATTPGQGSQRPALIRPMQKCDQVRDRSGRGSRPPLSPIKGLRTPTTPPPSMSCADSGSPVYHQLSPPRNIVDHRVDTGLSKPYVLRSSARAGDARKQVYVSPESDRGEKPDGWAQSTADSSLAGAVSPDGADAQATYPYAGDEEQLLGPTGSADSRGDKIYEAMSIEVKNTDENDVSEPCSSLVSPEKIA